MKERFIQNYVNHITKEDILLFAQKNNVLLKKEEVDILYFHLKKNWRVFLYGNPTPIFTTLKAQLSPTTYDKGIQLFYEMKQKYQSLL